MTWKTKGKIGCHFPDRSGLNPNFDVKRIVYSQDGVLANAKEIEKVYYISPAAAEAIAAKSTHEARMAELAKWLVWQRYWEVQRTLVAGDKLIAIEYVPTNDITVQSLEIFTTSNQGDNNNARVKILHESGLYIAAFNSDNGPDSATEYSLAGYKRYVNNQSVVLKGGKKYYIVYQHDDANPGENTFWPAYFQNENGNYKEYSNNRDTVTTTDVSSLETYIGETSDLEDIFNLTENDFFIWQGDNSYLEQNALYIRSNKGNGTNYQGNIGDPTTYATITKEELVTWLSFTLNDSYRWNPGGYHNLTRNNYYYKNANTTSINTFDVTGNSDGYKLASLFYGLKTGTKLITSGPSYWMGFNEPYIGTLQTLKNGYRSRIEDPNTPIDGSSLPADAATGDIFFIRANTATGIYSDWVCVYNQSDNSLTTISDVPTYSTIEYIDEYMTNIGSINDLVKQKISGEGNISSSLRSATLGTTRKYYLKINGNEV